MLAHDLHHDTDASPRLASWQDSPAIIELRNFLKSNSYDLGAALVISGGYPTIRFSPGLGMDDPAIRWQLADRAVELAMNARRDLLELVRDGRLRLPVVS